jgi:hypothetical protein
MMAREASARLKSFFYWSLRRSFKDLGFYAPEVADYISGTLARFARSEALYRLESGGALPLPESVVEMMIVANESALAGDADREREIRKHEADYILFMAGLFRRYLERRRYLGFYLEQGRHDYHFLFEFERARFRPEAALYLELSESFEGYVGALNYMRQVYFRDRRGESLAALREDLKRLT